MNNPNKLSKDPSRKAGNRKVRNGVRAMTAAAAIALAACAPAPSEKPEPAPQTTTTIKKLETTTTTTPEKQDVEALNTQMQASAEGFATQIINEYQLGKSPENFIYDEKNGSNVAVNVLYNTDTLLGGAYGEYGLIANVHQNKDGSLDPATVDEIYIFSSVNNAGKEKAEAAGDRVTMFNFSLRKDKDGNWSGSSMVATKGGEEEKLFFAANTPLELDAATVPMTSEIYGLFEGQAATVLSWAVEGAPVNYAPGIVIPVE